MGHSISAIISTKNLYQLGGTYCIASYHEFAPP